MPFFSDPEKATKTARTDLLSQRVARMTLNRIVLSPLQPLEKGNEEIYRDP
jgi:hypothetical protein